MSTRVAIIGTREPTEQQIDWVTDYIAKLPEDAIVVSGCAEGIDQLAIMTANKRKLFTVGCLPWYNYNPHVSMYCSELKVLDMYNDEEALESVQKYHSGYHFIKNSPGVIKLHARNYLIIQGCDTVLAAPSNKVGLGGTGQGVRIALDKKIKTIIYSPKGKILENPVNMDSIMSFMN